MFPKRNFILLRISFFGLLAFCLLSCQQGTLFATSKAPPATKSSSVVQRRQNNVTLATATNQKPVQTKSPSPENPSSEYREFIFILKSQMKRFLDVVFGIDPSGSMDHHSGSMDHHLPNIGRQFFPLFTYIQEYDWQIGFITADHGDHDVVKADGSERKEFYVQDKWQDHVDDPFASFGKLMPLEVKPTVIYQGTSVVYQVTSGFSTLVKGKISDQRILTPQTPNYEKVFLYTVSHFPSKHCESPPFCQEHLEQPLRAFKSSMERVNYDNKDIYRPNADLVLINATNEGERPGDQGRATSAHDVVDTFNAYLKPLGKRLFVFNFLIKDEDCLKQELEKSPSAMIGNKIAELAVITGGFNISICDSDYEAAFKEISKTIKTFVEQSVDIEEPFIPETLQVEFLDEAPFIPHERVNNRIIFERAPLKDTRVRISYRLPN